MSDLKRGLFGYRTASVRAALAEQERMFRRASMDAQSADERAERLASELWETQRRLEATEELARSAREAGGEPSEDKLAADLERSVAEREAIETEALALRKDLTELGAALAAAESAIAGKNEELRVGAERLAALESQLAAHLRNRDELGTQLTGAQEALAELADELRQRDELLTVTQEGASKARGWLLRTLEESAGYKRSLAAEQERVAELEELIATYRAELQERVAATTPAPAHAPMAETTEPAESVSNARELAAVLQITEDTVVRIIGPTPPRPDVETLTVDEDGGRVQAEVEGMKAWRDNAAPKISSLQSRVDEVLGRVADINVQLDEVLRPVTGAITRLSSQLASLDALSDEVSGRAEPPSENGDGAIVIELPDEQAARPDAWRPR